MQTTTAISYTRSVVIKQVPGLGLLVGVAIETEDALLEGRLQLIFDGVVGSAQLPGQNVHEEEEKDATFPCAPGVSAK